MSTGKAAPPEELTFSEIMAKASKSAFRGGLAGGVAMGANVACLMWMRTTVRLFARVAFCVWLCGEDERGSQRQSAVRCDAMVD